MGQLKLELLPYRTLVHNYVGVCVIQFGPLLRLAKCLKYSARELSST